MCHFVNELSCSTLISLFCVHLQKEGVYISKLNMILVQVNTRFIVWYDDWRDVMKAGGDTELFFFFWFRSWSRNGPNTGPPSSATSWVRVGPARASVRTTWSSSSCSARRSLTSPVDRWPRWRPSTSKTGNWWWWCTVCVTYVKGRAVTSVVVWLVQEKSE